MPNIRDKRLALVVAMLLAFALVAVLIGGPKIEKTRANASTTARLRDRLLIPIDQASGPAA